jgi:hypothetical protein
MKGDWNPGAKYSAFLEKIDEILSSGEQRTVRDVYYALEARGFPEELQRLSYQYQQRRHQSDPDKHAHPDDLPRSEWIWGFEYRYVKRCVKKGRRAGIIDAAQIIDASRSAEYRVDSMHDSPRQFIEDHIDGVWSAYRENFWREQETYVECWLEKQSLASVFEPVCDKYNVRLEATRGDWSDSKVYEATQRLSGKIKQGKDVRVVYFGDFNPSGYHAPVSILDAMGYYGLDLGREFPESGDPRYYDVEHRCPFSFPGQGSFGIERIALTLGQIERFDLPENPMPSSTDKDAKIKGHFQNFVSDGRDTNIELNALKEYHRDFLVDLVEEAITEHIDMDDKERVEQRAQDRQQQIADAVSVDYSALEDK